VDCLALIPLARIREVNDMRNILTMLFCATLLVIMSLGTLSGLGAQDKPAGFRDLPVRNEINQQYQTRAEYHR
jgi:hypothetical protein